MKSNFVQIKNDYIRLDAIVGFGWRDDALEQIDPKKKAKADALWKEKEALWKEYTELSDLIQKKNKNRGLFETLFSDDISMMMQAALDIAQKSAAKGMESLSMKVTNMVPGFVITLVDGGTIVLDSNDGDQNATILFIQALFTPKQEIVGTTKWRKNTTKKEKKN